MLKRIESDFYDISTRLKRVSPVYHVFYNTKEGIFQVYEMRKAQKIFLFNIGKNLDNRAIKKAFETSFRNFKKIFRSIENTNLKIEEKNATHLEEYSKTLVNSYLDYANRKNTDVDFRFANTFRWI